MGNSGNFKEQIIKLEKAKGTATAYSEDRWRIGYGETGFETFTIDVPDALRGKVATLRFVLDEVKLWALLGGMGGDGFWQCFWMWAVPTLLAVLFFKVLLNNTPDTFSREKG